MFWDVFENVLINDMEYNPKFISVIAVFLDSNDSKSNQYINNHQYIKRQLIGSLDKIDNWLPLDKIIKNGILSILHLDNSNNTNEIILDILHQTIENAEFQITEETINNFTEISSEFFSLCDNLILEQPFEFNADAESWCIICNFIKYIPKELKKIYKTKKDIQSIYQEINKSIREGKISIKMIDAIKYSWENNLDDIIQNFLETISKRICTTSIQANEMNLLCSSLFYLRKILPKQNIYEKLNDSNFLNMNANLCINEQNTESIKKLVVIAYDTDKNFHKRDIFGPNAQIKNFLRQYKTDLPEKIVDMLYDLQLINIIIKIDKNEEYSLIKECYKIVAIRDYYHLLYTSNLLIENWRFIQSLDNNNDNSIFLILVKKLSESNDLPDVFMSMEKRFNCKDIDLYKAMLSTSNCPDFIEWCKNGIVELSKEDWLRELKNENFIDILCTLSKIEPTFKIGTNLFDALVDIAENIINETTPAEWSRNYSKTINKEVFNVVDNRSALKEKILNRAINNAQGCNESFFEIFGKEIQDEEALKQDPRIIIHLFSEILNKGQKKSIDWLEDTFKQFPTILRSFIKNDDKREFITRLQNEEKKSKNGNIHNTIINILRIIEENDNK